jgi:hypothetical protein
LSDGDGKASSDSSGCCSCSEGLGGALLALLLLDRLLFWRYRLWLLLEGESLPLLLLFLLDDFRRLLFFSRLLPRSGSELGEFFLTPRVILDSSTGPLEATLIFFETDVASTEPFLVLILALGSACAEAVAACSLCSCTTLGAEDGCGEPGIATCGADFGTVICVADFGAGICVADFGTDGCELTFSSLVGGIVVGGGGATVKWPELSELGGGGGG